MDPRRPPSLAAAVAWAAPSAVLAGACLPLAALLAALGVGVSLRFAARAGRAGLWALPMVLAAAPGRPPPPLPACAGPVRLSGQVRDVVRAPTVDQTEVTFAGGLRLRLAGDLEVLPGDELELLAFAGAPAAPGWPRPLRGVAATATVTPGPPGFSRACAGLRRSFERALLRLVPGEHGPTLATLVLGRATRPDAAVTRSHRATGLSHLLAVSGAHAAMLAFLLGLTSRGRRLGASRPRLWFVLTVLTVYGCVAGAEPPVLRAVVAFLLGAVAARTGRPSDLTSGLLAPALVTAAWSPEALTGPSFLLSYAAVIGLGIAARGSRGAGPYGWLRSAVLASFWATLLTTPLTLWFFGQVAPGTILLTPLCAPLVALMLLLGLLAATLAAVAPWLSEVLALPLQALAHAYALIVQAADSLPGTPVPACNAPPPWLVALAAAGCAVAVYLRPRRRTLVAAVAAVSALWFAPLRAALPPGLRLFAVGHGQAALLVHTTGETAVLDCGSLQGGARAARAVLEVLAGRAIDLLVVTHADSDHHNGVPMLAALARVRQAALPEDLAGTEVHALLAARAESVTLVPPGGRLQVGELTLFAPTLPLRASDNDRSLWARAQVGGCAVLFSGDAQELGVAAAIAEGFAAPADLLVLPHHGRPNANTPQLLRRVRPRACFASSHRADGDTVAGMAARRFAAEVWTTGRHGDLWFDGQAVSAAQAAPLLAAR